MDKDIKDRETKREEALSYVEGKYGIEDFMAWFIDKYTWFDKQQLKMSLDAWCESKSRSATRVNF